MSVCASERPERQQIEVGELVSLRFEFVSEVYHTLFRDRFDSGIP